MAKEFIDFTFAGKKLSDLATKYVSVDFNEDTSISLAMNRDIEVGETNRYKVEANYFGDKWSDTLQFELDIVKDIDLYSVQTEREISQNEVRELTRWLTSLHFPQWIKFDDDTIRYFGWFTNIETFVVSGAIYGLKLHFKCTTPFGYTNEITNKTTILSCGKLDIENNSDEIDYYCYPTIEIYPNSTGQIYICNMSDCKIYEHGTLSLTQTTYFDSLLDAIDDYALMNGYTVEYSEYDTYNIVPICDDTAVQFKLVDVYGNKIWCTAFYINESKEYQIIEGGFIYMSAYKDLKIHVDCKKLTINDDIGRMITYGKLGINDIGYLYWPRLLSGINTFLFYGDCEFAIKHIESRKVGE